jgi:hypothetical protein
VTTTFGYDVQKLMILLSFNVQKDSMDKNYEKNIMKTPINVCKMLQGVVGDFMSKMIMEDMHKSQATKSTCPIAKVILFF